MLKTRNWFPEHTEIYTTQGWVNISIIEKKDFSLVGYESEEIVECKLKEFNKHSFEGPILSYKAKDIFLEGLYIENYITRYRATLDLPKIRYSHYNGYLYNIVTTTGNFIIRSLKGKHNNNDYNIVKCQISVK